MSKLIWRFPALLLVFGLLMLCASCGKRVDTSVLSLKESGREVVNQAEGLSLTVDKSSVSPESLTLTVVNSSNKEYTMGNQWKYELEAWSDGKWKAIEGKTETSTDEGYPIPGDSSRTETISWTHRCGTLPKGKYRILVPVSDGTEIHWLASEFVL